MPLGDTEPVSRRFGAGALVGIVHVVAVICLIHGPTVRNFAPPPVVVARVIPEQVARPAPAPMLRFSLPTLAPPRIQLPVPDVVLPQAPVPDSNLKRDTVAQSISTSTSIVQSSSGRSGPTEIQNVQYARPISLTYPAASRRLNETGVVVIRVLIDAEGRPVDVVVERSSGHSRLDDAAVAAVRQAVFRPHRENGIAQMVQALVPIRFELK